MFFNLTEKNKMIIWAGFVSFLLLILAVFCFQSKSIVTQKYQLNKLSIHIFIAYLSFATALIHGLFAVQHFRFSSGVFAIVCVLLTILSGMVLRYTQPKPYKKQFHVLICVILLLSVLIHVFDVLIIY